MFNVGLRKDDDKHHIFCICPYCFQTLGMVMTHNTETYRKCLKCKTTLINPKLLVKEESIRIQWHYDPEIPPITGAKEPCST